MSDEILVKYYSRVYTAEKDGSKEVLIAAFLLEYEAIKFARERYITDQFRVWVVNCGRTIWKNWT